MDDNLTSINLTPNDIWNIINQKENSTFGIEGYESPKLYFDYRKNKENRELLNLNQEVWAGKNHYPKPKVTLDINGNPKIPTKLNFIDEVIKKSHSGFSKEKFDKYVEVLIAKGKTLDEIEGRIKAPELSGKEKQAKLYRHDRRTFISEIMKNENKRYNVPEDFKEKINLVNEKHAKYKSEFKNESEKIISQYKNKTSLNKSDRVTFLSDSEFTGESIPFYNTKIAEENSKENKKLFFPEKITRRFPKYSIKQPTKIDKGYLERKEELIKNKAEEVLKSWENKKIKFIDDLTISYSNSQAKIASVKYSKPTSKKEEYNLAKERSPIRSPGPQQYFKTPEIRINIKKTENESEEKDENGLPKVYYMNRDKTDKRIYKPMKNYVF